jgi:glycerophosphoryl diester phosphodiesterase
MVLPDDRMPYPRICAHRGFNTVAPENSLPAYGAAVALGAEEIEFDVWATKDGVLVSSHDPGLERVSDGEGLIYEHTYEELLALDFGAKCKNEWYRGLKICTFEEILKKFSGRVIMNIHVKIWDMEQENRYIPEIVSLIRKYDCEKYIYFMTTSDKIIREVQAYAPDLAVCVGWDGNREPMSMVDRAIALGAKKVQLYTPYFNADTVKYAHENGIRCNVFYADLPELAREYLTMGIDCILTNNYLTIYNATKDLLEKKRSLI